MTELCTVDLVDPRLSLPDELVGEVSGFNVHAAMRRRVPQGTLSLGRSW